MPATRRRRGGQTFEQCFDEVFTRRRDLRAQYGREQQEARTPDDSAQRFVAGYVQIVADALREEDETLSPEAAYAKALSGLSAELANLYLGRGR